MKPKRAPHGSVKARVLERWDAKKTCAENARACGLTPSIASVYACQLKLKFVRVVGGQKAALTKKADRLWDKDLTVQENAAAIGMTPRQARDYVKNHPKPYKKAERGGDMRKLNKKPGRRRSERHSGVLAPAETDRQAEIRKLVAQFRKGGKRAAKAAKKLKKLGIIARAATETDQKPPENIFPFVMTGGIRQMPAGTKLPNPNLEQSRELMAEAV